jgi:hypothetical protein
MENKQNDFKDMSIVRDDISEFRVDYGDVLPKLLTDLSVKRSLYRTDIDLRPKIEYSSLLFLMFQKNTGAISLSSLIISDNNYEVNFNKAKDEFLSIVEYILPMVFQGNPMANNYVLRVISTDGYVGELPRVFIYDINFTNDKSKLNKLAVDILVVLMALDLVGDVLESFSEGLGSSIKERYPYFSKLIDDFVLYKSNDIKEGYKDLELLVYKEYYNDKR